jgi:AraC family transcriptional regulator
MPEPKPQPALTPRIENRKALLIAGSQRHYSLENVGDIPSQWQSLPFGRIPCQVGHAAYGVCNNAVEGGSDFDYLAGVEVSTLAGLPSEFAHISIAGGKYAIFPHRDHVSKLKETIDMIMRTWRPASRDLLVAPRPGEAQMIEYYGEDFNPATGMGQMEIWLPVKD